MSKVGDDDYNRALDALEAGDLSTALQCVESALMSDSKDSGYWQLYSILLAQAGRVEDAAKAKLRAEECGLDEVDTLLMKAAEAAAERNWNKAVTACERALDLAPERGEIWASYAANLMEGDYRKDALEASAKAAELLPEEGQVWYLRGRILRLSDQHDEALEAFERALALDPSRSLVWYEKGMILHLQDKVTAAKECFLEARKLNPGDETIEEALKIVSQAS
ncbi:tetratricopeptide repeat protein [Roseibacillus ishigakijimensis]|uniref:Tetratricopeptide repeat protein n=1 Tax=Roseibacillus ishigakijimensis TaxID=454146 RepID=A0A934VL98_9BACT|nr:tetratricopeptide repeat protein [Roseibacillus ishigakijimensis]MBK1834454.1 tetratricopeptide repeat protein [Roseibacillus ishigakijimensis]